MKTVLEAIQEIPEGYSEGWYKELRYGITKKSFNGDRSYKVYAEALGGNDFISLNYYRTGSADVLRPCEMPEKKVIDFLTNLEGVIRTK